MSLKTAFDNIELLCHQDIMDASGVALVLIGPGSIEQVCQTMGSKCVLTSISLGCVGLFYGIPFSDGKSIKFAFVLGLEFFFVFCLSLKVISAFLNKILSPIPSIKLFLLLSSNYAGLCLLKPIYSTGQNLCRENKI